MIRPVSFILNLGLCAAFGAGLWLYASGGGPRDPGLEENPPLAHINNICALMEARPGWWRALLKTERRWGAPPPLALAVIWRESGFRADARPPRKRIWGFLPGARLSSAYGYAQAIDGTWRWYGRETGRAAARRDDFSDAADFVGWYLARSKRGLGLSYEEALNHYIAYHEGHGGYVKPDWRENEMLLTAARQVALRARLYESQLSACVAGYENRRAPEESPMPRPRPDAPPRRVAAE